MLPKSTDPKRFHLSRFMRELRADGLSLDDARDIAEYVIIEEPAPSVRQASLYADLSKNECWPCVYEAFSKAGVDTAIRPLDGAPVALVPTVDQIFSVYQNALLPLCRTPWDAALPLLADATRESLENRVCLGVARGTETFLSEYLLQSLDALAGLLRDS